MRKRKFTCAEWPAGVLGKRSYINKNAPLKQPNISAEEHSPLVLTSCAQTSTLQSLSGALRVMQYDSKKKKMFSAKYFLLRCKDLRGVSCHRFFYRGRPF